MARDLKSRTSRLKLKVSPKPYFISTEPDWSLGYRRGAGTWTCRHYNKDRKTGSPYETSIIGPADDTCEADGKTVFNFWQACEAVRAKAKAAKTGAGLGPLTVRTLYEEYKDDYSPDNQQRFESTILATIGDQRVDIDPVALTPKLRAWHRRLAAERPCLRTGKGEEQKRRTKWKGAEIDDTDPEYIRRRQCSANRALFTLKGLLQKAFVDGKIASNVGWARVKAFADVSVSKAQWLKTPDECKRLLNGCEEPEFKAIVGAGLVTGRRWGELRRMRAEHFDRDAGTILIPLTKPGKVQHVALTDEGINYFVEQCAKKGPKALIFPRPDGLAWTEAQQEVRMANACQRAGIKPAVSFHALRHTWATLAIKSGVPLLIIAKNMGHADLKMLLKHYGHVTPDDVSEKIRETGPRFLLETA
jgi:integrase